jgi:hypothetical protein
VPKICRWKGIVIEMFAQDHPPPHFHAQYAEFEARIAIETLDVLSSDLPNRVLAEVFGWARLRQAQLIENWDLCRNNQPPKKIAAPE